MAMNVRMAEDGTRFRTGLAEGGLARLRTVS